MTTSSTKKTVEKPVAAIKTGAQTRPPVVVVMGHIDHGKSTLLDYIRKTNIVDKEVGGITQRMSAYEVTHEQEGIKKHITFLDTPGHESFNAMRARGALSADIAILIVSAEDAVKPQTLDAYKAIKSARLPFIVGISKIDKPNASVDKAKLSLAENEIYVEGYGGDIPFVPFSGKTGEGVDDLLDMILLTAEVEEFTADHSAPAECIVIEANRDNIRGVSATLIVKNGTLKVGDVLVSGLASSSVRILEDFTGKTIKEAGPSKPVRVVGWSEQPEVGGLCFTFKNKKEAEVFIETEKERLGDEARKISASKPSQSAHELLAAMAASGNGDGALDTTDPASKIAILPIIIKGDTNGTLEAVKYELQKIDVERVNLKVVQAGIGDITENDVKLAGGKIGTLIIGFNTKVDNSARQLALRMNTQIETFDIIYKLTEWLKIKAEENIPKRQMEEETGTLKILKIFSRNKDKQVIGGRVEIGTVHLHDRIKIMRRDAEIGRGNIRELQQAKNKVGSVEEGKECGLMVESKIELVAGDKLVAFEVVMK
jgi:translation initiation factor IF-2